MQSDGLPIEAVLGPTAFVPRWASVALAECRQVQRLGSLISDPDTPAAASTRMARPDASVRRACDERPREQPGPRRTPTLPTPFVTRPGGLRPERNPQPVRCRPTPLERGPRPRAPCTVEDQTAQARVD